MVEGGHLDEVSMHVLKRWDDPIEERVPKEVNASQLKSQRQGVMWELQRRVEFLAGGAESGDKVVGMDFYTGETNEGKLRATDAVAVILKISDENLDNWAEEAARRYVHVGGTQEFMRRISGVHVVEEDWGVVAYSLARATGSKVHVLNMANATTFGGGGQISGSPSQEANMFRRTTLQLQYPGAIGDDATETGKRPDEYLIYPQTVEGLGYSRLMQDNIEWGMLPELKGVNDKEKLLDKHRKKKNDSGITRVAAGKSDCAVVLGPELMRQWRDPVHFWYAPMAKRDIFSFHEIRSAAPDMRVLQRPGNEDYQKYSQRVVEKLKAVNRLLGLEDDDGSPQTTSYDELKLKLEKQLRNAIVTQLWHIVNTSAQIAVLGCFGAGVFSNDIGLVVRYYGLFLNKKDPGENDLEGPLETELRKSLQGLLYPEKQTFVSSSLQKRLCIVFAAFAAKEEEYDRNYVHMLDGLGVGDGRAQSALQREYVRTYDGEDVDKHMKNVFTVRDFVSEYLGVPEQGGELRKELLCTVLNNVDFYLSDQAGYHVARIGRFGCPSVGHLQAVCDKLCGSSALNESGQEGNVLSKMTHKLLEWAVSLKSRKLFFCDSLEDAASNIYSKLGNDAVTYKMMEGAESQDRSGGGN